MTRTTSTSRSASNGATTAALAEQVQQLDGVVRQLSQDLPSTMAQALSQALAQSLGQAFAAALPALAEEVSRQVRSEFTLALASSTPPANPSPVPVPSTPASPEVSTAPSAPIPAPPVAPVVPSGRLSARVAVAEQRLGEWSGRQGQRLRQGREVVSRKVGQARSTLAHKAGQVRQAASQQAEQVALWLKATRHLQKRALACAGVGLLLTLLGPKACAALLCLAASGCAWAACAERGWPRPAAQNPAQEPVSSAEPTCIEEGGQPVIAPQALPLAAALDSSDTTSSSTTLTPATVSASPDSGDTPTLALPEPLPAQPDSGADDLPAVEQQTDSAPAASNSEPLSAGPAVCPVAPAPLPA